MSVDYIGQTFPKTKNVDFFKDQKAMPQGIYTVMGRANINVNANYDAEDIRKSLISKAQQVGADAVVIVEMKKVQVGERPVTNMDNELSQGPVGFWGSKGRSASGAPIYTDSFSDVTSMSPQTVPIYDIKGRVLFMKRKNAMTKLIDERRQERKADLERKEDKKVLI